MNVFIDQSGKIEDTNKLTVVACCNGKCYTVAIKSTEKQKLIKIVKKLDFPKRTYIYKIFATMVYLSLQELKPKSIIIDKEYPGHEGDIKNILLWLYKKNRRISPNISFGLVTKKSKVHNIAIET